MDKCKNCKFFRDGKKSECHRLPPCTIQSNPSGVETCSIFPSVDKNDECGEFVQKVE